MILPSLDLYDRYNNDPSRKHNIARDNSTHAAAISGKNRRLKKIKGAPHKRDHNNKHAPTLDVYDRSGLCTPRKFVLNSPETR